MSQDLHNDADSSLDSNSPAASNEPRQDETWRYILVAMVAVQAVYIFNDMSSYWELVRTGSVSALSGLVALVSLICLYSGSTALVSSPRRGKRSFLIASIGLVASFFLFGAKYSLSWPFLGGAVLAHAGFWYTRHANRGK